MGFFVAQEEPFASLLEWDNMEPWTFQRHFRNGGSPKAFEQISDCQLIYGPNAYDYDGVDMDLHSAVNGFLSVFPTIRFCGTFAKNLIPWKIKRSKASFYSGI